MSEIAATAPQIATPVKDATGVAPARAFREGYLYVLLTALVAGAWAFTRLGLYSTKSDLAYWLGVSGGVGMLLLFSYPMRKHLRFMHRMGPAKGWFVGHMVLGVAGPILILLHSNFELGSVNATVAFVSMAVVALSGVVGRFLYIRLHRSLNGEKLTLGQLRQRMDSDDETRSRLRFEPAVLDRCRAFERSAVEGRTITGADVMRVMLLLPWQRWRAARDCRALLRRRLVALAHTENWSRRKLNARLDKACALVDEYLAGAQRVALFSAWERLFSWWHVAHVPFVYILVISAVVHVIAVHAY